LIQLDSSIQTALLTTADLFETNPVRYGYGCTLVPDCGTPGCAVGYVGFFMGLKAGTGCWVDGDCASIIGVSHNVFIRRMDAFEGTLHYMDWRSNAADCAKALRLYADEYHPETITPPEAYPTILKELERISREVVVA